MALPGYARDGRVLGRVVANKPLGSLVWLTVEVPGWRGANPGQFALLQPEPSRCFLARAFSVADNAGESVSFLITPVGEGSRELCGMAEGEFVWVLGPLGNGFDVETLVGSQGRVVIVAGGVGVAPFPLFLSRLAEEQLGAGVSAGPDRLEGSAQAAPAGSAKRKNRGGRGGQTRRVEVLVLLGFRDAEQTQGAQPVEEVVWRMKRAGLPCRAEVVAEDGSRGRARRVTDLLERYVAPGDRLAVCGPWEMARTAWHACSTIAGVQAWFSLEANMACGVGSCHGCVVTLADGSYARVCHDGPVFAGRDVFGG